MDPADSVQQALSHQGALLGSHEQLFRALAESNQSFSAHVTSLCQQMSHLASSVLKVATCQDEATSTQVALQPRDSHVSDPEPFYGDLEKCQGFVLQCGLIFRQRPLSFSTDAAKINYVVGLMRGRALAWIEAMSSNLDIGLWTFNDFEVRLRAVFDHPSHRGNASSRLLSLRQGNRSVADYSVDFWTLAADSGWNDAALQGIFIKGLNEQLKDELAARDEPADLPSLVSLAIRLDNRLHERRQERSTHSPGLVSSSSRSVRPSPTGVAAQSGGTDSSPARPGEEPMQPCPAHSGGTSPSDPGWGVPVLW